MGRRFTSKQDIGGVISLFNGKHKVKKIVKITSLCERTVQRLIKQYKESGETLTPVYKPKTGRPKKITRRTGKVLNRQVTDNPRCTASELKEINPQLLVGVSLRSVQQFLHDELSYCSYRARRKPLLSRQQKE